MVQLFLIALMVLVNIFLYGSLPAQIPTHWGLNGQIDGYMAKEIGILIMPGLAIIMSVFLKFLPQFDPKNKNYKLFAHEWNIMQIAIVGLLAYMNFLMIYFSYNPNANFMNIFFVGLGAFFILFGNYLSKIRQNYFIGIRTPWTLDNADNWNKTHRYASWCFVITGIIIIIEAFVLWLPAPIIFGSIILASIFPMLYSFLLFKNKESLMKIISLVILGLITLLFLIKGLSGEDGWMCQNGQWVKHGHPDTKMPIEKCIK